MPNIKIRNINEHRLERAKFNSWILWPGGGGGLFWASCFPWAFQERKNIIFRNLCGGSLLKKAKKNATVVCRHITKLTQFKWHPRLSITFCRKPEYWDGFVCFIVIFVMFPFQMFLYNREFVISGSKNSSLAPSVWNGSVKEYDEQS